MSVNVSDLLRGKFGILQGLTHCRCRASAILWGRSHMIGVAAHSKPRDLTVDVGAACNRDIERFKHQHACTVTEHKTISVLVPGTRRTLGVIVAR